MKFVQVLKAVALAAAAVAASSASAANLQVGNVGVPVTFDVNGLPVTYTLLPQSSGVLTLNTNPDSSVVAAFNVVQSVITPVSPAVVNAQRIVDPDGDGETQIYTSVAAAAPITQVTLDVIQQNGVTTGANVVDIRAQGGMKIASSQVTGASRGGDISIFNIRGDLTTNTIFADLATTKSFSCNLVGTATTCANGASVVKSITNIPLFRIGQIEGVTSVPATFVYGTETFLTTASQLSLITGAYTLSNGTVLAAGAKDAMVNGMRLLTAGVGALNGLTDFGSLSTAVTVTAVPEPSTYALMALGVAATGFMARRRRSSTQA